MRAIALLAALALAAGLSGCGSGRAATTATRPPRPEQLAVYAAGKRVALVHPGQVRVVLPRTIEEARGRARLDLAVRHRLAVRRVKRALAARRAHVTLPVVTLSSTVAVRPVRQTLHNDCEATALSMLLAAAGVRAQQLELQKRLPRSGPLDPEPVPGSELLRWGDPERGFVGRAAGGGTEGGFGVYEPPVRALARRYGVHLDDLRGRPLTVVRSAVLAGHPVLAWVGLAAGPYLSWLTPSGRRIRANLNEHAVVLVGAGPGYVLVNNPLTGKRERWSEGLFSYRWKLLDRRALELPRT